MMGKDILEYSAQKAAELSFDQQTKAQLEQDPERVKGEQAAVDAAFLAVPGLFLAGAKRMTAEARAAADTHLELEDAGLAPGVDATNKRFPATEATVRDYAEQRGISETEAREKLQAAGYEVPGAPEPVYLKDWNEAQNGPKPTYAQYRAFQEKAIDSFLEIRRREQAKTAELRDAAPGAPDPAEVKRLSFAARLHMEDVADAFQRIVAPATRSDQALEAANILRASTGEGAAQYEQAAFKLDEFRRAIDPLPDADKLGFIDAIEGGRAQTTPEFQAAANSIRQLLDGTRDQIRELGTGKLETFIEHYFPHIWEDPERAGEAFRMAGARRPFEGGKAFLKKREIPTTAEGMQLGLKPVSTNPVDLTMLKLREMQKYLTAHRALADLKDADLVKFVRAGDQPPENYTRIDDRIATVFGPRQGMVELPEKANIAPDDVTVMGNRILGQYYAPEPVATVVNNHLSPGLAGNAIYDAYRGLGNTLNQAQLGLSAFHLGFTSMDATVSRAALGLEYLASGKPLTGLGELLSAPAAPITNAMAGAKLRRAYLNPESATPDLQSLVNAVKEAGGRVKMDSFYKNSAPERMAEAWKEGEPLTAARLSIPALLEYAAKPIMEHIVPMQKLGIFGDMAQKILEELPADATLADRRAALAKAWDSVDNRMGQVVYDNLFWNRTFKDLSMASVRSVGWNLGTLRELGGGAIDLTKLGKEAATGGDAELTHRAAYVLALPMVVGMYGAIYQMLRTGEPPKELKDYFYPRTGEVDADGNPERVQVPSYMKDMFAYAGHPYETVKHKFSPAASTVLEMLENQDYYGDQIRNVDDPAVKQAMQEAGFVAKQVWPFAIRNLMESKARGAESIASKAQGFFGITPAPREAVRSDAQNQMMHYLAQRQASGATPEDATARQSRRELLTALRNNVDGKNTAEIQDAVSAAIERHQLTPKDVVDAAEARGLDAGAGALQAPDAHAGARRLQARHAAGAGAVRRAAAQEGRPRDRVGRAAARRRRRERRRSRAAAAAITLTETTR
jgi:hypothetical protein